MRPQERPKVPWRNGFENLDLDGQRLAVSLTTLDFEPSSEGTNLKVTVQMVRHDPRVRIWKQERFGKPFQSPQGQSLVAGLGFASA
jgi:hypothetical protein